MAKTKIKSPISLLIVLVDDGVGVQVEEYLTKKHLKAGVLFNGKGTAESEIADIFGFGLGDRDIVACIVPVDKQEKILADVTELTGIEKDNYGLTMLLPIDSASSTILELMGITL